MKLIIVMSNLGSLSVLDEFCTHLFICLATVVSRSWDMSLKCP